MSRSVDTRTYVVYGLVETRPGHRYFGRVRYVGQTEDLEKRVRGYRKGNGTNQHMERWIRACAAFGVSVLATCDSLADAWVLEMEQIALHSTYGSDHGLNYRDGGCGGSMLSDESRRQIADTLRARYAANPQLRVKISETLKELYQDPEYANMMRQLRQEWASSPDNRALISERTRAAMSTDAVKARLREGQSQRWLRDDEHAKASAQWSAYWADETRRSEQAERVRSFHSSLSSSEKADWRLKRTLKMRIKKATQTGRLLLAECLVTLDVSS